MRIHLIVAHLIILHSGAFAQALKVSDPNVEQKICGGVGSSSVAGHSAKGHCNNTKLTTDSTSVKVKPGLLNVLGELGKVKWPNISGSGAEAKDNTYSIDASGLIAQDMISLAKDEKAIVAGHLAKTVEGGEVVEIRSVSTTSVMVNACYDLLSEGISVVPYACVGLGGNFVEL